MFGVYDFYNFRGDDVFIFCGRYRGACCWRKSFSVVIICRVRHFGLSMSIRLSYMMIFLFKFCYYRLFVRVRKLTAYEEDGNGRGQIRKCGKRVGVALSNSGILWTRVVVC